MSVSPMVFNNQTSHHIEDDSSPMNCADDEEMMTENFTRFGTVAL